MNLERVFFWIRLLARVILEVFPEGGAIGPEMKPERIQVWLQAVANAALDVTDEFVVAGGDSGPEMKPERIQFWLQLIARFVLAAIAGANGETGKSGESKW